MYSNGRIMKILKTLNELIIEPYMLSDIMKLYDEI